MDSVLKPLAQPIFAVLQVQTLSMAIADVIAQATSKLTNSACKINGLALLLPTALDQIMFITFNPMERTPLAPAIQDSLDLCKLVRPNLS